MHMKPMFLVLLVGSSSFGVSMGPYDSVDKYSNILKCWLVSILVTSSIV